MRIENVKCVIGGEELLKVMPGGGTKCWKEVSMLKTLDAYSQWHIPYTSVPPLSFDDLTDNITQLK